MVQRLSVRGTRRQIAPIRSFSISDQHNKDQPTATGASEFDIALIFYLIPKLATEYSKRVEIRTLQPLQS